MTMIRLIIKTLYRGTYQPIPHPDCQDIIADHGELRFKLIAEKLPIRKGRLLDIGAYWGYFCHRFEDLGFDCTASEISLKHLFVMRMLRKAMGKKFKIERGSIFDMRLDQDFDVVIALNVFHHFLKEKQTYDQLIEFLKKLNTRYFFFQPSLKKELEKAGAYRVLYPAEFVFLIQGYTGLKHAECIGKGEFGRPVYLLWR